VFNVDGTGVSVAQFTVWAVLMLKGSKEVAALTSTESCLLVTGITCMKVHRAFGSLVLIFLGRT